MTKTKEQTLFCTHHQENEPVSNFHKNVTHTRGYEYVCKEVRNQMVRDRRAAREANLARAREMGLLV